MSQASFENSFNSDSTHNPNISKRASKKKLLRRNQAMGRAIEALESRQMLSVSGFQPAVNYTAGAFPRAVASGDFNGDGKTDLVVVNQTGNNVSVLLNSGNGTFGSPTNFPAGTGPRALVVGDFNGDHKLDIAVADQSGNTVAILTGKGDGTFNAPVTYVVGTQPVALVMGDFNGDGKPDLATANSGGGVSVLTGKGDGTFNTAASFTAGTSPDGIVTADFNHDNKLDLAVSNGGGGVSVLNGAGNGTFSSAVNYAAGVNIRSLAQADFNGDGYADLAVVNGTAGTVSILTNNGSGAFSGPVTFNVGATPVAVTAADFNNDGKLDLAVANSGGNTVSVLSGNGNGTFGAAVNKTVGTTPQAVVADDFNADGSTDLAVVNNGGGNVSVLLDKHITVTGQTQTLVAGGTLSGVTMATFTDSEAGTVVGDYTASIDWGDGHVTHNATITLNNGVFSVAGTNTYHTWGVFPVVVTVQDTLGTTATATTSVESDDAAITAAGTTITATEGASFSGTVGNFTDANTYSVAGDFLVAIDWGDGTSSTGTVVDDGGGAFHVTGSHVWQHNSTPSITMDVTDSGGQEDVATTAVTVNDALIHGTAETPVFTEGTSATRTVATFTDDNPFGSASEFSAVITWGDGSQSSGTITSGDGVYSVSGTHKYLHAGNESMSVAITSTGGSTATVTPTATVHNATLASTGHPVTVVEGAGTGSVVVASFTDSNSDAVAGDFSASVNWGDSSSPDVGSIAWNAGTSKFDVTAPTHSYDHAGGKTITVTITGLGGGVTTATPAATVNDAAIVVTANAVNAMEGTSTGSILLGTFTDANANATAGDFSAKVTWGDGTAADTGTSIVYNSGNSNFEVYGTHTYAHAGPATMTLTVTGAGGSIHSDHTNNTVANAAIPVVAVPVTATEGSSFNGKVASFTSASVLAHGSAYTGDFTASIDWGDGTSVGTGTVTWNSVTSKFDVTGIHTYAEEGSHPVLVTINGLAGGTNNDTGTATIADAALHSTDGEITATEGQSTGSIVIATFTDEDPNGTAGDYTASVNWGDFSGIDTSTTITWNNVDHVFEVRGTHTYAHAGGNIGTVTITDSGGAQAVATLYARSNNDVVTATAGSLTATEGQSATGVVAHFVDANAAANAGGFIAVVDWGDNSGDDQNTSIVWNNVTSRFDVSGTHTYDHAGPHTVGITIHGSYGIVAQTSFSTTVSNDTLTVRTKPIVGAHEGVAIDPYVVAHFTDANAAATADDFTANIAWGDTTTTTGAQIVAHDGGGFDVIAGHTFDHAGPTMVQVTVNGNGGGSHSDSHASTILNQTITASNHDFSVVEGIATGSKVVASFTDANAAAVAGDFTATIDWGDSSSTDAGTIAWNAATSTFDVTAPTHTYAHAGTKNLTVTINGQGTGSATATPNASVTNAAITVTAQAVSGTEGVSTGSVLVGTFTDANAAAVAGDFTATIDWGDGNVSHNATIQANGGHFDVLGNHLYGDAGTYSVKVTVDGNGGGSNNDSANATVANALITATRNVFTSTEGVAFTGKLIGTFTDANTAATAGKFSVSIDWGDGTALDTTTGVITSNGSGFNVKGDHSYAHGGTHTVTFTVTGAAGGTGSDTFAVNVGNQPLHSSGVASTYVEGVSQTGPVVAHFTDDNSLAVAGDFTATVNFSDGTTLAGAVVANSDGGFDVQAPAHTFDHAGNKTLTIVIHGTGGGSTQTTSTAAVGNALITTTAQAVTATEGASTGSVLVATFTDANPNASAGDFTASVVWSTGATADTATTIVWNNVTSKFEVYAAHSYNHAGSKTMTVTVNGAGGGSSSNSSTFTVANATLTATGLTVVPVEGASFTGAVAHFTDANGAATIGDFTATIDWGDGSTPVAAVIVGGQSGGFDVTGTHTYAALGTYTPSISIQGNGGGTASVTGTANVADAALSSTGTTVTAIEGTTATGLVVAHFTDANPNGVLGSYTATITWGDGGATSVGTITSDGVGGYNVTGSHLYTTAGTDNVSVLIGDSGTSTTTASTTATVNHGTINATPVAVVATEGTALVGTTVVANFTDTNLSANANGFAATIDWGDSTGTSTGTIVSDGNGGFNVLGGHTYAHAGPKTITVSIAGFGGTASVSPTATVHNAAISVTAKVNTAVAGIAFSGVVGSFTDANASATAGDFTASVDWGDGNTTTGATIVWNAVTSKFDVSSAHTYHIPGNFTTTLTITGAGGGSGSNQGLDVVQDGNISPSAVTIHATEGTSFSGTLASFTDQNPEITVGALSATVNWGDGSAPEAATLVSQGGGVFNITGSHTWTIASSRNVSITINDIYNGTATVSSTAIVADAALASTGVSVNATEGATLSNVKVMHFTDANPYSVAGDFTVNINWGDTTTSTGVVTANINGGYDVTGTHTYAHAGTKTISVTAADAGGASTTSTATATIANATLGITAGNVTATEGQLVVASVATFTDVNPSASATDFTATIDWGDGTTPTVGAISDNGNGGLDVLGGHTYKHAGNKTITVTVNGNGGGTVSQTVIATVANASLAATGLTASATEGVDPVSLTVAHFTDANTFAAASDFTATITWANGVTTNGTVVAHNGGGFDVVGDHTYNHAGVKAPVINITGAGGGTAQTTGTVNVANAAMAGNSTNRNVTEGHPLTGVLGNFTDANSNASAADFTGVIHWGDNTTDVAVITANVNGGFDVTGPAHSYAHSGSKTITVNISGNAAGTATILSTVAVGNDTLTATSTTPTGTEGTGLSNTTVFAHFTDANALAAAGDFTASIDFGDGNNGPATVVASANGGFDVIAGHTYSQAGDYTATVSILGAGNGTATATSTVHINNAIIAIVGLDLNAVEGTPTGNQVVAHFTDTNASAVVGNFTATVNWGDDSELSNASIVANVHGGFDVVAGHTYDHAGGATITVTLTGSGGATKIATSNAIIANAEMSSEGNELTAVEGTPMSDTTVVAWFTDANQAATSDDFIAIIHWGDESQTSGTVVANGDGGFNVLGGHTYSHAGSAAPTVTITGFGGGSTTATSSVDIANADLTETGTIVTMTEGVANVSPVMAHFTDANSGASAGDFTATIAWGDGSTSDGHVVAGLNGGFNVTGSHAYAHAGDETATITVNGLGGGQQSSTTTVHVNTASMVVTGKTLTATEGANFSGAVATFTDANGQATAGDFTASINWGDNTTSIGTVSSVDGVLTVTGSHTYSHLASKTAVVTITGAGGQTASGNSSVTVNDADYGVAVAALTATEGTALSNVTVGTITDTNTLGSSGNFTVSINWGDGSAATTGTLVQTDSGVYTVKGSHTFSHAGNKTVTMTVTSDGGSSQAPTGIATVQNALLTATGLNFSVTAGKTFTGKVAHFTDANAAASPGDFTASISWADGTTTTGTVVANSGGGFDVTGSHGFRSGGSKAVAVTITGAGGGTAVGHATATVAAVASTVAGTTVRGTRGVSFTATVATIATANVLAQAGDYTATITWADGTTSTGTVVAKTGGGFNVVGTHTYSTAGTYVAKIAVVTAEGTRLVAGTTLPVAKPLASRHHTVGGSQPTAHSMHHQRHIHHVHHVTHTGVAAKNPTHG